MMKFFQFLSILSLFVSINGLKVLGILPFGSKSHFAIGHAIIKSLVDAGHEATVLSPYPLATPIHNYREINIAEVLKVFDQSGNMNAFMIHKIPLVFGMPFLHSMGNKMVEQVMEHSEVKKLMESDEKFDVCFLEIFHANAISGIFDHFGCVYIPYTTGPAVQWIDVMTANISPTSYIPAALLPFDKKMTFSQRFWNTFYVYVENLSYYAYHLPKQRKLYQKYFPNAKKSLDEMITSPAIVLLSNHISITGPRPMQPNMIEIGGIHVTKKKNLPDDLKKYLDSAKEEGVILFSMGSVVQAKEFPVDVRDAFVKSFGKLKQKVIWKYENETLPNKPDNVMISSWLPQRDILAHPNVKLFISHGGYLGSTEAVAEGVPVLGLPLYGDQYLNIANAVNDERGLMLDFDDISEEKIEKALNEILTNLKYQINAKKVANIYKDRPVSIEQTVVYWTEYAVRHKGAKHLRSAGNDLTVIEFYSIDVYLTIAAIIIADLYLNVIVIKFLYRRLFKGKNQKVKKN